MIIFFLLTKIQTKTSNVLLDRDFNVKICGNRSSTLVNVWQYSSQTSASLMWNGMPLVPRATMVSRAHPTLLLLRYLERKIIQRRQTYIAFPLVRRLSLFLDTNMGEVLWELLTRESPYSDEEKFPTTESMGKLLEISNHVYHHMSLIFIAQCPSLWVEAALQYPKTAQSAWQSYWPHVGITTLIGGMYRYRCQWNTGSHGY